MPCKSFRYGDIIVRNRGNGGYYLRTIAVIPEFQGLGIGSKAIQFIERDNPEGKEWSLITPEKSYRNRHFYEKLGYENYLFGYQRPDPVVNDFFDIVKSWWKVVNIESFP